MKPAKTTVEKVEKAISNASAITILTHINPDADTLGTGLGIFNLLKKHKKKAIEIVNVSDSLPQYLDFLPGYSQIKSKMDFDQSLIISCDCGSLDRLGVTLTGRNIINIDHHESNNLFGTINVVDSKAASASQVAYRLFKEICSIDKKSAECFYTALFSDTRFFTTSSVNAEVFAVAKEWIDIGVKPDKVAYHFIQRRSLASLRVLQKALSRLTLHHDARIASTYINLEDMKATGATMPELEGIVDYARSLSTVEIGIFAMELEGEIRVSLRSKKADVSKVASFFDGGGHKVAAGFTLKQSKIEQSIDTILEKIEQLGILNET